MKVTTLLVAAGFALAGTAPTVALAQVQNGPEQHVTHTSKLDQHIREHLRQLHAELHVTSAQQQQWDNFAHTVWRNVHNMHDALSERQAALHTMNAAQNMDSYARLAEVHAHDMRRASAAFDQLYAAMSPQQQQEANQLFLERAERRAARHHRHG